MEDCYVERTASLTDRLVKESCAQGDQRSCSNTVKQLPKDKYKSVGSQTSRTPFTSFPSSTTLSWPSVTPCCPTEYWTVLLLSGKSGHVGICGEVWQSPDEGSKSHAQHPAGNPARFRGAQSTAKVADLKKSIHVSMHTIYMGRRHSACVLFLAGKDG